jgi:hypothetical protein
MYFKFCYVWIADLHWKRAGVSEPLQKVGSLLWGTGEGLSLQGTVSTAATHVSIISFPGRFRLQLINACCRPLPFVLRI